MKLPQRFCHDVCIVRNGVRGGTNGAFYRRWHMGADYNDGIEQGINYRHWIQIKRVKKLCNNDTETRKGQDGYNPSYKIDYIW